MCFQIRTALGNSKAFYKHTTNTPIQGTGLLISSLLIDCLKQLGNGMTMNDVMGKRMLRQLIEGFVNDTSLFSNLLQSFLDCNNIEQLTSRLSHDMVAWKEFWKRPGKAGTYKMLLLHTHVEI
jgi:hypothetical protein